MTIQNWRLTADQATVVCDSLGSSVDDWSAIGMVSKCWVVPHLGIVLAVKNWMLPGLNLYLHLAHGLAIQRWSDLIARAPSILRETAANHSRHYLEHAGDCRVAAFGYDDRAGIIAGCLLEGDSNFEPQPVTALDVRMPDPPGLPADDWNRALAQQAYDLALPKEDMDNIGGPLIRADLLAQAGHPIIIVRRLGVLPDAWRRGGQAIGS
jgi:hypothetical protein